jgi:hypothetical protein
MPSEPVAYPLQTSCAPHSCQALHLRPTAPPPAIGVMAITANIALARQSSTIDASTKKFRSITFHAKAERS